MKIHELITLLRDFDEDEDVQVLGTHTEWGYSEESGSYEMTDVEWMSVEGVERTEKKGVRIYAQTNDL